MNLFKKYLNNQRGALLAIMGVVFIITLGIVGAAIDFGTAYMQKNNLQNAADAAALAGAGQVWRTDITTDQITQNFVADFVNKNEMDAAVASYDSSDYATEGNTKAINIKATYATPSTTTKTVRVELRRRMPTYFIKIFGFKDLPVVVVAKAQNTKSSSSSGSFGSDKPGLSGIGGKGIFKNTLFAGSHLFGKNDWDTENNAIMISTTGLNLSGTVGTNGGIWLSNYSPSGTHHSTAYLDGSVVGSREYNKVWSKSTWNDDGVLSDFTFSGNPSISYETPVNIKPSNGNAETSDVQNFIDAVKSMSLQTREKEGIYYDTTSKVSYEFDSNKDATDHPTSYTYPGLTSNTVKLANPGEYPSSKNYNIIIVDGDLIINMPSGYSEISALTDAQYIIAISLHGSVQLHNGSAFQGIVYAPNGELRINGPVDKKTNNGYNLKGSFIGDTIRITTGNQSISYASGGNGGTTTEESITLIDPDADS